MEKKIKARSHMSDKRKSVLVLSIVLVLTIAVGVLSMTGLYLDSRGLYKLKAWVPTVDTANWPSAVPLGLALGGGTYVEYTAAAPEGSEMDMDAALDKTVSILRARLDRDGYLDAQVSKTADGKIRVEMPNVKEIDNVFAVMASSGDLKFSFPDGVFLEGGHVKAASSITNGSTNTQTVKVTLDAAGTKALAEASASHTGQVITISMDGQTMASGTLDEPISNGEILLSNLSSAQEIRNAVTILRSGALPVTLTGSGSGAVEATLGSIPPIFIIGGLVLLAAAMAVLIARYLLGGLVAAWALWIHLIFSYFLIAVFPVTQITLLGLVGIALTSILFVGFTALYIDKFAKGLKPGRMHKVSVKEGWELIRGRVWKVHGICIAVALVLLILPIGFLRSFAVTALAGTVSSLLVTLIATRSLLEHAAKLVGMDSTRFARGLKA